MPSKRLMSIHSLKWSCDVATPACSISDKAGSSAPASMSLLTRAKANASPCFASSSGAVASANSKVNNNVCAAGRCSSGRRSSCWAICDALLRDQISCGKPVTLAGTNPIARGRPCPNLFTETGEGRADLATGASAGLGGGRDRFGVGLGRSPNQSITDSGPPSVGGCVACALSISGEMIKQITQSRLIACIIGLPILRVHEFPPEVARILPQKMDLHTRK